MIEHGKIFRADYRTFTYNTYISIDDLNKHTVRSKLIKRIRKYFEGRSVQFAYEEAFDMGWIKFAKLDDAQMFVLAFSDVIETKGQRFD